MTETIEEFCLGTTAELDPVKTFECGQCFRWNAGGRGVYTGVAGGRAARVLTRGRKVYIRTTQSDFEDFWRGYFDLDTDYESLRLGFDAGDYLRACADYGAGIRLLRQDGWETLCSFIISQCNNIPRIKRIVETLCREFGTRFQFDGESFYAFPAAPFLAGLEEPALAPLRCGYRAKYILAAARAVSGKGIDLEALAAADSETAMSRLMELEGVGKKVASCVLLFGLGHTEAFPVDVWMKRALKLHFPPDFDPASLGPYAGLAQQYIYYYARSRGGSAHG